MRAWAQARWARVCYAKKITKPGGNHVTNLTINSPTGGADIVITRPRSTDRARKHAPKRHHISLVNFLDGEMYNQLVTKLLAAQSRRRQTMRMR